MGLDRLELRLQRAQLPQVIHAVGERFDVTEQHRARAATARAMPGAVDVQPFLGGFLALGDGVAYFLSENFRAAARERFKSGVVQFAQRLFRGFLREPGEVQDFNRGETFELQPWGRDGALHCPVVAARRPYLRVERSQCLEHVHVVTERQRRMQSADDVQFRNAELERLTRLFDHLRNGQLETIRVAFLARERAELAAQDAVIRVVDVAIDDVAGAVANLLLPREISDGAEGVQVFGLKQPQRVGFGNALAGGDLVLEVAQFAALDEEMHPQSKEAFARQRKRANAVRSDTVTTESDPLPHKFRRQFRQRDVLQFERNIEVLKLAGNFHDQPTVGWNRPL